MNIRVLKRRLGTSNFNGVFLKMTLPQKFRNKKLNQVKHSWKIGKCGFLPILKIAQNLSYRFFLNFGS